MDAFDKWWESPNGSNTQLFEQDRRAARVGWHARDETITKLVEALRDAPLPGQWRSATEFSAAWMKWYRGARRAALAELEKP